MLLGPFVGDNLKKATQYLLTLLIRILGFFIDSSEKNIDMHMIWCASY